jgi:hypothetical protein
MRGVKTAGVHTDEVVFKHCSNSSRSEDAERAPRPRPRHSHTTTADDQARRQAASVFHHYNRKEGKKDGFFIYICSVRRLLPGDGARAGGVCWVKIGSMHVPVNRLSKVEVDVRPGAYQIRLERRRKAGRHANDVQLDVRGRRGR